MLSELERTRTAIEAGPTRGELRAMLPPGGARTMVDAATGLRRSDALEQQVRRNRRKQAGNT